MSRLALALPPTIQQITPFQDAYLSQHELRRIVSRAKFESESPRYWSFGGIPTTIALSDNRYAKSLDAFQDHAFDVREINDGSEVQPDYSRFYGLLEECAQSGVPRPSGYADVFHET